MNSRSNASTSKQNLFSREEFSNLLDKAIQIPHPRFVRQAAAAWLGLYPGDIKIYSYMAAAQVFEGKTEQAIEILQKIVKVDPEFREGYELLLKCLPESDARISEIKSTIYILGGRVNRGADQPEAIQNLRAARLSFINQQVSAAEQYLLKALGTMSDSVIAAILHLQITRATSDTQAVQNLAGLYTQRWPDCVLFSLYLAEAQIDLGSEVLAVNLLHECAARDAGGIVPARIWGKEHPYKSLWTEVKDFEFTLPIPSEVSAAMGWNQIGNGVVAQPNNNKQTNGSVKRQENKLPIRPLKDSQNEPSRFVSEVRGATSKPVKEVQSEVSGEKKIVQGISFPQFNLLKWSENLVEVLTENAKPFISVAQKAVSSQIQSSPKEEPSEYVPISKVKEELAKVALKLDAADVIKSDHRFPIMVILSVRSGLEKQFGKQTFIVIDSELKNLAISTGRLPEWNAMVLYVDDAESTGKIGVTPIDAVDPWKIKLLLTDLDNSLAKKGEMIGSLVLVGGPEILPFHRLPNPTDDLDDEVLSDSPYATRDTNYFVPEWPVTRLPGGKGPDSGLLLEQIRRVAQSIEEKKRARNFNFQWPDIPIFSFIQSFLSQHQIFGKSSVFGYSAEIWRRSSEEVFAQITNSKSMLTSPPIITDTVPGTHAVSSTVSYFNLHGLVDSAEWYGQRDMAITQDGPDYPVALKPEDLYRTGPDNGIVYSEACYGAHISGKDEEDSIALKFLSTGSACVIGSTCTSYGSVTTPLIGADLLGFHFFKHIKAGKATGEAFYHARIDFIQEMQRRQGYLDGEDQKTLISFVMYGNPFASTRMVEKQAKTVSRQKMLSDVCAVCTKDHTEELPKRMGNETLAKIKKAVEPYLPGIGNAHVYYSRVHTECDGKDHVCPTSEIHSHSKSRARSGKMVVSISKSVNSANRTHSHFARVTLDSKGKMIKLAVSR